MDRSRRAAAIARLLGRLAPILHRGRPRARRSGPVRLVDAPVAIATTTRGWLRDRDPVDRPRVGGHQTVVADQVRALSVAMHRGARGLTEVVDLLVAAAPSTTAGGLDGPTVTVDLPRPPAGTRATADIVTTIEHLAARGGSPSLAVPADARDLTTWIADEIEGQIAGRAPSPYASGHLLGPPPCPLLRAAMRHDLGQATIHAYRHPGFTPRQVAAVRSSAVADALTRDAGATLDQLYGAIGMARLDLLTELGHLIELGAVFGISHHWYPYDITVVAHLDAGMVRTGCGCPVTA